MRELRERVIQLEQVPTDGLHLVGGIRPEWLPRLSEATEAINGMVTVDLHLKPENDVYLLSGTVEGSVRMQCEFCRAEYDLSLPGELSLTIDPGQETVHPEPGQKGEVWVIPHSDEVVEAPDGRLDLYEVLEDEWLLNLPQSPLCSSQCKGLCPVCGTDRNEAECGCQPLERPNPFAKLAQLKTDSQ
jgi:uncharacterized protein